MTTNWREFDGWCSARGIDAIALPPDRAVNLYRFAITENADEKEREKIEDALRPPVHLRVNSTPVWYGSDDDAWSQFARQT
jgi:hypothetical protein